MARKDSLSSKASAACGLPLPTPQHVGTNPQFAGDLCLWLATFLRKSDRFSFELLAELPSCCCHGPPPASYYYRGVLRCPSKRGSSKGDCYDNAVVKSFFATLEWELIERYDWHTRQEAQAAIFEYIEVWYNRQRRHSTLGYRSPVTYEQALHTKQAA